MKKNFLLFVLILFGLLVVFTTTSATWTPVANNTNYRPSNEQPVRNDFRYKLMVPLPLGGGETTEEIRGIVDYIRNLYYFAAGVAGVLAMAMIIYAGFRWATAMGSMTAVSDAKEKISNAVLGLILLLASYLILNSINPALVGLREPYIYLIKWSEPFPEEVPAGAVGPSSGECKQLKISTCYDYTKIAKCKGFGCTKVCISGTCSCQATFAALFVRCTVIYGNAPTYCNSDACRLGKNCVWYEGSIPGADVFNCHER